MGARLTQLTGTLRDLLDRQQNAQRNEVDAERSVGTDLGVAAIEEGGARDHEVVAAGEAVRADISEPSCNQ